MPLAVRPEVPEAIAGVKAGVTADTRKRKRRRRNKPNIIV